VEVSGLGADTPARLQAEAAATTLKRVLPGGAMFFILILGFAVATDAGRQHLGWATLTLVVVAGCGVARQVLVTRALQRKDPRVWFWLSAFTLVITATFGTYLGVVVHSLGASTPSLLLVLVTAATVPNAAHAYSARTWLMRVGCGLLVGLPLLGILTSGSHLKYVMAAMLTVQLFYAIYLGGRLGVEYWSSAFTREQLHELIAKNPDALGIVRDGEILFINPAWSRSLQTPIAEVVGTRLESHVHPDDAEALRAFLDGPANAGPSREFAFQRRDGTSVSWEILPGQELTFEGRVGRVIVARDVTDRNLLREQLLQAERLASLGTMAAGVAHEINNPLTYVLGNIDHVLKELPDLAEPLREALVDAREGAQQVSVIVRDLKAFSRVEKEQVRATDLERVLELAVKMTASNTRHRATVGLDLVPMPPVLADEAKLGQVFVNLLLNAADAIADGDVEGNEIAVATSLDAAGNVVVTVRDTGGGIPDDVLPRIFDPFFTTKAVGTGTGLGLAICHTSVRSFGGEISVTSEVGHGTTFTIRLVACGEIVAPPVSPPVSPGPIAIRRLLVIDDDVAVARAISRMLGRHFDVVTEHGGAAALSRLDGGERFDVVLCDVMMPGMTGIQLQVEVERRHPGVAATMIFMSGGACTAEADAFVERFQERFIAKPFTWHNMQPLLERVLPALAPVASADRPPASPLRVPRRLPG
jgi:PAS domain S-box-containing protein